MGKVATVLGDMDASELGHCQPHEHVYIVETPALIRDETLRINNLPLSINELKLYKSAGGDTIVDAQPLATGRDAAALQEASFFMTTTIGFTVLIRESLRNCLHQRPWKECL